MKPQRISVVILAILLSGTVGCQRAYFGALEAIGMPKRELFVKRVEAAREAQAEGKEEFRDALEQFRAVIEVDGGDLAEQYDVLSARLERSENRAEDIKERIEAVESVSEALFSEWEDELDDYTNAKLRSKSERSLEQTRNRYERLIAAMHKAESKIPPVLEPLRDQVLYLKHNLNARAVASLDQELVQIEGRVDTLIEEMEEAIAEADRFIATMEEVS
ncbi:MAG: DUF2959 domain-containing protein [Bdellovibrionales bacterium]|nr:DUF2959 domain-containing protein [Bdellovibrionales bacterium]